MRRFNLLTDTHPSTADGVNARSADEDIKLFPMHSRLSKMNPWPRIAINVSRKVVFLDPQDISTAEAKGNYVLLHYRTTSYLIREPIAKVEESLRPYGFVRIHRGILINAALAKEFIHTARGEYLIRTVSGKEYRVSRTYKQNVRLFAESWLGSTLE